MYMRILSKNISKPNAGTYKEKCTPRRPTGTYPRNPSLASFTFGNKLTQHSRIVSGCPNSGRGSYTHAHTNSAGWTRWALQKRACDWDGWGDG